MEILLKKEKQRIKIRNARRPGTHLKPVISLSFGLCLYLCLHRCKVGPGWAVKKGRSLSGAGLQRYKQVACQKYIVPLKNRWLQCGQPEKRQSGSRKTARHNRNCLKMTILFVPNCHKVRICLTELCALLCFAGEAGKEVLGKGRQWQLPALLALIPAFSQREKGPCRSPKEQCRGSKGPPGSKGAMPRPSGMAAVVWCQIGLQPIASVRQQLLNQ